jgi:flavin-dependent dehydrogenase
MMRQSFLGELYVVLCTADVVVVGGGPAGSTIATLLTQAGLRVAVFEQTQFPRFHVGESLLPSNLPIFDRLGCHDALRQADFMVKPGATLYDEYEGRGHITFAFPSTRLQPASAYHVVRASFDDILLQHAAATGALVYRQHTVKRVRHEPDNVVIQVATPHGDTREVQAQVLVDASGRASFLGTNLGQRMPLPDLGKVALVAHFQGAKRDPTIPPGNARIYLVPQGWLWWFSFTDGTDSIGCVLHARVVKARQGSIEALFEEVLATSPRLTAGLAHAQRMTPVHTVANFSYRIVPCIGDRYVAIGDAAGFIDPIFSTGVFLAMRSAELAADAILQAFQHQDFSARRFQPYATQLQRGMAPFLPFIRRFYEPAFLDVFFTQRPRLHLDQPVLWVLSGAVFDHRPLWLRLGLALFFGIVHIRKIIRWATGLPVASHASW